MNKLIVFPGTADAPFFLNEIDYMKKYFDEVVVISYKGNEDNFKRIAKEKEFHYKVVNNNILKTLISLDFYKWLFAKETLSEIKSVFSLTKKSIFRLLYIFYYGIFYINAKRFIDKEIKKNGEKSIFLYSFWLTRGAYTVANYNRGRKMCIKKLVSRAHGYDLYEERNTSNYLPFRSFINENLDEIHFISNHGFNYFKDKYQDSKSSSKKSVSRLGTLNPYLFKKQILNKEKICIVSCSSIIPVKRLDLIIDIISNVNFPVKWIHIGAGELKRKIELYAFEKLKEFNFQFLGEVNNSEILKIYMNYDVDFFINMSDSEGVPVSIMEAISVGIPVIARNVGGICEIVNNNTGLLLEHSKNMEDIYYQVNQEIQNRVYSIDTYKAKIDGCLKLWSNKYNSKKNYEVFFDRILSTK